MRKLLMAALAIVALSACGPLSMGFGLAVKRYGAQLLCAI
jgi:hypothetical protein